MEFRLAILEDLPKIKETYFEIIKKMNENNLEFWDEIYPCDFFEADIRKNRLYILLDNNIIVSAFSLNNYSDGAGVVQWTKNNANAIYLKYLGVNTSYLKKGIASLMLTNAIKISKQFGAEYLRLFVICDNKPATKLYEKNHFKKAKGIFTEVIGEKLSFNEYGYEIKV